MRFLIDGAVTCDARDEKYEFTCKDTFTARFRIHDSCSGLGSLGGMLGGGASVSHIIFPEGWPEGWSKVHDRYFCPKHKAQAAVELKRIVTKPDYKVTSKEGEDGMVTYMVEHLGEVAIVTKSVVEEVENV